MENNKILNFKNKKVLVFGLGLLGGGVATTNWLIKHGAKVTITDLKSENYLEPSLRHIKGKPKLKLNGHDKKDIEENEIIVFNPDVSINNPFVKYAQESNKQIENEATIFYKLCAKPIIAVTGTRGKTTTANWTSYFLNSSYKSTVSGNSSIEPLLKTLDASKNFDYVVNEIPSFHLEYFNSKVPAPKISVITNLYQDHLNRHKTMENYALVKANIFRNQRAGQNLVLNYDNPWTKFFLKQKLLSQTWFFSMKKLPQKDNGVFYKDNFIYFQNEGNNTQVVNTNDFAKHWGNHNIENLLASALASHLSGITWKNIEKSLSSLPQIPFREETIFKNNKLQIINDTSATSPDGGIAAINRFGGPNTILVTGGTDRELDFKNWSKIVSKKLKIKNIVFLEGSATNKMIAALNIKSKINISNNLKDCIDASLKIAENYKQAIILFSPASKSFEKFKNEFDRGNQFNRLVKKVQENLTL